MRSAIKLALALGLGVAVLAALLLRFDMGVVWGALARVGIGGFLLIVAAGLAAEIVLAAGLVPLLPARPSLTVIFATRQLRDSASDVLPITQLGGLVLSVRVLALAGMDATAASASVIADITAETFAQGLYVLTGVLASLSLLSADASLSPYIWAMLGGAVFMAAGAMGFALVQLTGGHWVDRITQKLFGVRTDSKGFHAAIHAIYRRRGRMALSLLLQFLGWVGSGLWLWVVMRVMGLTQDLWVAIAIQALVEGLRSATLFIPAAIGVQEAGYAALAPVFGFAPELGLAISLLRRARDLVVAVPVLILWHLIETRRALRPPA